MVPATLFVAVSVYALINHLRIPFYDNWSLAPLYGKLEDGTLTVGDLFQLHGSHWHASGYAVMLANAKLTGMALWADVAASLAVALLGYVGLIRIVDRTIAEGTGSTGSVGERARGAARTAGRWRWALLAVVAVFYFSLDQDENWLWGWQIALFLSTTGTIWVIELLGRPGLRSGPVAAAGLAALVAVYGFATAWGLLPIGLYLVWATPAAARRRRLTVTIFWLLLFAALVFQYRSLNDTYAGEVTSDEWSPGVLIGHAGYIASYLGAGLMRSIPSLAAPLAVVGGLGFVALLLGPDRPIRTVVVTHRGPLALALFALGAAALTALGRWARFGADQAFTSRYVTFSNYFWIALAVVLILAAYRSTGTRGRPLVLVALVGLIGLKAHQSATGTTMLDRARAANGVVCDILDDYPELDRDTIGLVATPTQPIERWMGILHRERVGIFRSDVVADCARPAVDGG